MSSALAFEAASCPASLAFPWVDSNSLMTSPAIQIENIGIVLYREIFLAITGQLKTTGGDQTPTAWRKEEDGIVVKRSLRTINSVTSVMPMFFCAPPKMTAYLLTSTCRLRKLELMSATTNLSSSPGCWFKLEGKPGNSTPSTVYSDSRHQLILKIDRNPADGKQGVDESQKILRYRSSTRKRFPPHNERSNSMHLLRE